MTLSIDNIISSYGPNAIPYIESIASIEANDHISYSLILYHIDKYGSFNAGDLRIYTQASKLYISF